MFHFEEEEKASQPVTITISISAFQLISILELSLLSSFVIVVLFKHPF